MSYAAPEVLKGQPHVAAHCDVWALGVILSILLTGETPFPDTSYAIIGRMRCKTPISSTASDLLAGCFIVDPERRRSIERIKSHPWFDPITRHRGSV
jgi:serine/threonine protein kinase